MIEIKDVTDLNINVSEFEGYSLNSISSSDTSENCDNIKNNYVVIGDLVYFNVKDDGSSYLNTANTYTLTYKNADGTSTIQKILSYNSTSGMWIASDKT